MDLNKKGVDSSSVSVSSVSSMMVTSTPTISSSSNNSNGSKRKLAASFNAADKAKELSKELFNLPSDSLKLIHHNNNNARYSLIRFVCFF